MVANDSRTLPLRGLRALVIGASSGIGLASARRLLADGANVTLAARNEARLREAARALESAAREGGGSQNVLRCDALVAADIQRAVETAGGRDGLDIAVTIPGGGNYSPVLAYADDDFCAQVDLNLRPVFLTIKYAGRAMLARGGSIVAISSTAAVFSSPYLAAYCAAKAAIDQLVRVAADELGAARIRINAVRPGLTRTGATGPLIETRELHERFLREQPIARAGEPEDIASCVRYLAGPESGWVTGQCITVDGGHTLRKFPDLRDLARRVAGDAAFAYAPAAEPGAGNQRA
jgi:NAD(P)-dependent dehydrogenase (short-subunit alcohol dehydrogenase family)